MHLFFEVGIGIVKLEVLAVFIPEVGHHELVILELLLQVRAGHLFRSWASYF